MIHLKRTVRNLMPNPKERRDALSYLGPLALGALVLWAALQAFGILPGPPGN